MVADNGFVTHPRFFTTSPEGGETAIEEGVFEVARGNPVHVVGLDHQPIEGVKLHGGTLQNGSLLTAQAFEQGLGGVWGSWMVTIGVFLFAVSTIISWSYYGDRAAVYLFGQKGVRPYRLVYAIVVLIGSNLALTTVWGFGDVALSLMAIPNLIALVLLAKKVQAMKEDYFSREQVPVRKEHW